MNAALATAWEQSTQRPTGAPIDGPARLDAGDLDAFEEMARDNAARMFACARRLMGCEEDARDVVQDALLQAFRGFANFEGRSQPSTWLHRIVVNVSLSKLRSRKRRPEARIDDLLPHFDRDGRRILTDPRSIEFDALAHLERDETRAVVRRCIDRLPQSYRVVLVLRDLEDHPTAEVAALLGLRDGTVKVRLHRARQALRTLLLRESYGVVGIA